MSNSNQLVNPGMPSQQQLDQQKLMLLPNGDERLTTKTDKVEEFGDDTAALIIRLAESMYTHVYAVALAANQIGINRQIFIMRYGKKHIVFCNPTIVRRSVSTLSSNESSLTINDRQDLYRVRRSREITVCFYDGNGKEQKRKFKKRQAIIVQHEIDQLNGVLISDIGQKV